MIQAARRFSLTTFYPSEGAGCSLVAFVAGMIVKT